MIDTGLMIDCLDRFTRKETDQMKTENLTSPTVHLNGTAAPDLLAQNCAVVDAMYAALDALQRATPNARDYYTQDGDAFAAARAEHAARFAAVTGILREHETIAETIADQIAY